MRAYSIPEIDFPVPEFDDLTVAFGAEESAYPTREQLGDFYGFPHTPYHDAASALFYKGGKLADHGLKWKADIDGAKAMRAVRAFLSSFEPKHETKIGTVALAFAKWCDLDQSAKASAA